MKAPWHSGNYQTTRNRIITAANTNPNTRCWRCGQPAKPGDPFEGGHTINRGAANTIRPEHRSCNRRAAAHQTNLLKQAKKHTSARWG